MLLTAAFDIAYRDIHSVELKGDLLYVWVKENESPRIFPNGAVRLREIRRLKEVHQLHEFLHTNGISASQLARDLKKSDSTIRNLFHNTYLSSDLKDEIAKKYPGIFDE